MQRTTGEQRRYEQDMRRLHALVHYLHQGGRLTWVEEPRQGVTGERTITITVDGAEWDRVFVERFKPY